MLLTQLYSHRKCTVRLRDRIDNASVADRRCLLQRSSWFSNGNVGSTHAHTFVLSYIAVAARPIVYSPLQRPPHLQGWYCFSQSVAAAVLSDRLPTFMTCICHAPAKVWNNRFSRTHWRKWSAVYVLFLVSPSSVLKWGSLYLLGWVIIFVS